MEMKRPTILSCILYCSILSTSVFADEILDKAGQLIKDNTAIAAFELLIAEQQQRAGTLDPSGRPILLGIEYDIQEIDTTMGVAGFTIPPPP